MKKILSLLLVLACLCVCVSCGTGTDSADSAAQDASAPVEELANDPEAESLAAEQPATGSYETPESYTTSLVVKINPEFQLYLSDGEEVLAVVPLNADAESLMDSIVYQEGDFCRGFDDVLEDILRAADNGGFLKEDAEVKLTVTATDASEDFNDRILDRFETAVLTYADENELALSPAMTIAEDVSFTDREPEPTAESEHDHSDGGVDVLCADCGGEGRVTCPDCGGAGSVTCDECGGSGSTSYTLTQEKQVRNGYVCPYCGGAGVLDDGMHGGETAVCGYCTLNGGNGEWNELAYDTVTYEETIYETCTRCGGAGSYTCNQCGGSIIIDCPTCGGSGVQN